MEQKNNSLAKFGLIGIGQIALAAATLVVQAKVSTWLVQRQIEECKPKPIRGFQKTPLS